MLSLATSAVYWVLIGLWTYILVFCLRRLRRTPQASGFVRLVVLILLIDAGRTLFESVYFGTWYTARSGLLPYGIHEVLERPEFVFIPKVINVAAAVAVVVLIIRRWIPREEAETRTLEAAVDERTAELSEANTRLRQSEERYQGIVDDVRFGVLIHRGGAPFYTNPAMEVISGYSRAEMSSLQILDVVAPEFREQVAKNTQARMAGRPAPAVYDIEIIHKDGSRRCIEITGTPIVSEGEPAVMATLSDVTERKRAEEALRESEARFRELVERTNVVPWVYDGASGRFTYVGPQAMAFSGYPPEAWYAENFWPDHIHPDDRAETVQACAEATEREENHELEYRMLRADGRVIWVRDVVAVERGADGATVLRGFLIDVTERKRAEQALRESEELYRRLADHIRDTIWTMDAAGRITYMSPGIEQLLGVTPEEVVGQSFADRMTGGIDARTMELFQQAAAGELDDLLFESVLHRPDGVTVPCETSAVAIRNAAGEVEAFYGVTRDITERKRAEEARRESQERYRLLADQARDMIWTLDMDGRYTYVSPAAWRLFGFRPEELIGRNALDMSATDDVTARERLWMARARAGEVDEEVFESEFTAKDGQVVPTEVSATVIRDAEGLLIGLHGVSRDITERKRAEAALRESTASLAKAEEIAHLGNWVWNLRANSVAWSDEAYRIYGLEPQSMGLAVADAVSFVHPEDRAAVSAAAESALWHGTPYALQHRIIRSDGMERWVEVQGEVQRDADGTVQRMVGVVQDITERRRAEEALRQTRYSVDHAAEAVFWFREDGRFSDVNETACRVLGYSRAELLAMRVPDIDPDFPDERWLGHWADMQREGVSTFEAHHRTKDGRVFPVEITTNYLVFEGQPYVCAFVRDITERKRGEAALRQTRYTVDHAAEAVFWILEDGRFTDVNEEACRAFGYSREELLTMRVPDIDPGLSNEAWPDRWADLKRAGDFIFESTGRPKDGPVFPVEITSNYLVFEGEPYLCAFVRDITERKRAEDERVALERQVQHAQKLESLGVLAGGIAHDFNNLLTGMLGGAELALMDLPPESPVREQVEAIRQSALHAAELTRQMLAYSGKGRFIVEALDLGRLVEEISHLLEATLPKGVVLKTDFAPDLPAVEADAAQMRQVIMNLIINAGEAIGERSGIVTVSTGVVVADAAYLAGIGWADDLAPGDYVSLEVADTGVGMDADTLAKIFDPFFTTKFQGRGLGLAAVLGIVRGHHGALKIYSEPGRGTTFKLLLPTTERTPGRREPSGAGKSDTWRGTGTVLVVDDEEQVRQYAKHVLIRCGFTVLTADDGLAGVEVFRAHAEEIVLVLLDMTMPRLDGAGTFRELRRIQPDVRVILCSGYNEQDATSRFVGKGLAGFVQKPYRVQTLTAALRAALNT